MEISKFCVVLLSTLGMSTSFAMKQNVQVCLNVQDNALNEMFNASIKSSDFFDFGKHTGNFANGIQCVNHLYSFGPKNLRLQVNLLKSKNKKVNLVLDQSCYYFHNRSNTSVVSDYQRSDSANEFWMLTISHASSESPTYRLSCEYNPS